MADDKLEITYELTGAGWAKCIVRNGEHNLEMHPGYVGDALGDLVRATLFIAGGGHDAEFSFDAESDGDYIWKISKYGQVLEVADYTKSLFKAQISRNDLVSAVCSAAQKVLDKHGVEGYKGQWIEHDFPVLELEALQNFDKPQFRIP